MTPEWLQSILNVRFQDGYFKANALIQKISVLRNNVGGKKQFWEEK